LINADDVEITGFVISGSGTDMMHSDAGVKVHGSRAKVHHNRLRDNQFGVYLGRCERALIEGNTITGRKAMDMGSRGAGIHFYLSNHNTVRGNDVSYVRDGVYFDHSDNNVVEDNNFHDLRYGVHYMYCGPNEFYRNIFTRNVAGAAIMYTDKVIFSDNQIISNRNGYNAFGLLFQACTNCVAERNVIVNNTSGFFLEGSRLNRITHNLIAYNDVGVFLYGSSPDNEFSSNDFVGNLSTLIMAGKATVDWAPHGIGNYYSDYTGYDLDHDKVGDIPHKLQDAFENLAGNHPLLRLYLDSAAADALAFAEYSFPLLPSSDQYDKAPALSPVSGMRAGVAQAPPQAIAVLLAVLMSLTAVLATAGLSARLSQ
jgi:nitrous oxidase accessory protein